MTREAEKQFMNGAQHLQCAHEEFDSSGNHITHEIYARGGKTYVLEFCNGHVMGDAREVFKRNRYLQVSEYVSKPTILPESMPELGLCPNCGCQPKWHKGNTFFSIICPEDSTCFNSGLMRFVSPENVEKAAAQFNHRA